MKKMIAIFLTLPITISITSFGQTPVKEVKAGHSFTLSIPDYMSRTIGLNNSAAIQYKNSVKDVYGFIIYDTKEDLNLKDIHFSSINEFYDNFIKKFAVETEKRNVTEPRYQKKGERSFIESDLTYYDSEDKLEIYYLVGIVETTKAFYKVLSWSTAANKETFKADFQKILYSVND